MFKNKIIHQLIFGLSLILGATATAASYQLTRVSANSCFSVYGGSGADNTAIVQWSCSKAGDQIFSMVALSSTTFKLVAQHSGKCLEVKGSSSAVGAAVVQVACNTARKGQAFSRVALSNGAYTIKTFANLCVDVYGGGLNNGAAITQWSCNNGDNQQFKFADISGVVTPTPTPAPTATPVPATPTPTPAPTRTPSSTPTPTPTPVATPSATPIVTNPSSYPNMASATAKVELRIVHSAGELYKRGCDVWNPNSLACRTAASQYCVTRGYVGGYGPIDVAANTSTVSCVGSTAGDAKTISFSGACTASNPSSIDCENLAQQSCVNAGYVGSSGVVGSVSTGINTICIKSAAGNTSNVAATLSQLKSANSAAVCDAGTIASGTGCVINAHAYCKSKGYGTGFLVNSYNSGNSSGSVFCTAANAVTTELTYDTGYGQYARAAVLGQAMTVGGMTNAGDTTTPDVIVNNFSYPIVLTYVAPTTSYVAPNGGNYSLDTSVFMNHGTYYPNDPTIFDGEVISVYSSQPTVPTVNFGQFKKGMLLKPGDHVIYQGAAKWGSGGKGLYNVGTMQFQAVSEGYTPMLRRRFPSVDSSFKAGLVPAGCDASCSTQPVDSYVGFPATASNYWYKAPKATTIGGLQIFTNSPIRSGRVRVVNDAGVDIVTPYSFAMPGVSASWTSALVLGAGAFNNAFGTSQNGSSFLQMNIAVPAGARVGIEWDLVWGGDFAGFLYFNQ